MGCSALSVSLAKSTRFPAPEPSVFIGSPQMRGQLDRICLQVFITRGAKVSREKPGELCVVNDTDSGPRDWGAEELEEHSQLWSLGAAELIHQSY